MFQLILDEATRSLSGLILKNNIRVYWDSYPAEVKSYIRAECLTAIGDSSALIRATVGITVTSLLTKDGIENWPQLLHTLLGMLDSTDYNIVEVKKHRMMVFNND